MACYKESLIRPCGNEGNLIRRAGMLSATVSNSDYGGAGLLRPHLRDPVTELASFWGSHLIALFTLPVSVGKLRPEPQPQRVTVGFFHTQRCRPRPCARASRDRPSEGNLICFLGEPPRPAFYSFPPTALLAESGFFFSPDPTPRFLQLHLF